MVTIRKAKISDAQEIKEIIESYAKEGIMLSRPIYEIYESIRDFSVATVNRKIVGCCALHVFGKEYRPGDKKEKSILAEIRTLAVAKTWQKRKVGTKMVKNCIEEGKRLGITKIFILTVKENLDFFKGIGFKGIKRAKLPQKIWQECVRCPRFPLECNETALFLDI